MEPTHLIATVIITGVISGLVSSLGTVAALGVRVDWAKDTANRAHQRIDKHDESINDHEVRLTALESAK